MAQQRSLNFGEESEFNAPNNGKSYLLTIGIDEYKNFKHLGNAVLDAKTITDLLIKNFQFEEENTRILLNEEATRDNILSTLEDYGEILTEEDNFLLYFAGHGTMNKRGSQGFWIPVNAEQRNSQYIRNTSILEILKDFQALHIYLLVDSCFSGSLITRKVDEGHSDLLEALPSRRVLTSGRMEIVSDGRPGQHSPFAACIISYLKSKHYQHISSLDLEYHVQKHVKRNANQHPEAAFLHGLGDQSGQFVFRAKDYHPQKVIRHKISGPQSTKRTDGLAFKEASEINTLDAYEIYLKEFPEGIFKDWALLSIERLKEKQQKPDTPKGPIEMIYVEGGTFMMGSDENYNTQPIHQVRLDSFEIGKYPITQKEWEKIMVANPSRLGERNWPIAMISWEDAKEFLEKINLKYPEMNYRLPSEAEWEFAARGGNLSRGFIYAGSNNPEEVAWYGKTYGTGPITVGKKKPNELGIYDLSGNVSEWCEDWYNEKYYSSSIYTNPKGPETGSNKILRGGSWFFNAKNLRISFRDHLDPVEKNNRIGFRLARTP